MLRFFLKTVGWGVPDPNQNMEPMKTRTITPDTTISHDEWAKQLNVSSSFTFLNNSSYYEHVQKAPMDYVIV